jgi:hypothetical protein
LSHLLAVNCILFSCVLGRCRRNFTLLGGEIPLWHQKLEQTLSHVCENIHSLSTSMLRSLGDIIEKSGATAGFWFNDDINYSLDNLFFYISITVFSDDRSWFFFGDCILSYDIFDLRLFTVQLLLP